MEERVELERVTPDNMGKKSGEVLTYLIWKMGTASPSAAVKLSREARKWYRIMLLAYRQ